MTVSLLPSLKRRSRHPSTSLPPRKKLRGPSTASDPPFDLLAMGNCITSTASQAHSPSTEPPPNKRPASPDQYDIKPQLPKDNLPKDNPPKDNPPKDNPPLPNDDSKPASKFGTRRRLSLAHVDQATHQNALNTADQHSPRGTAKVYEQKPPRLETKLSLDCLLAQNGGAPRVSVMGAASTRSQGNFENKNETLRGNCRTTNSLINLGIGHACRKGLKPESPNQDDFFIYHLDKVSLYGVFDGHGPFGHNISNFVQQSLPKHLYNHPKFDDDTGAALLSAFAKMQEEIQKGNDRGEFDASLSGCTATVIVHDMVTQRLHVGYVGDSRAILARKDPENNKTTAVDLTEDHKPTLVREKSRIEASGGEVKRLEGDIPYRVFLKGRLYPGLAMSRALGDLVAGSAGVSPEPEICCYELDKNLDEYIVICSDGVWEFLSSQDAVDLIEETTKGQKSQVQAAADLLARESWNKWIMEEEDVVDDITVEIIYLNDS